MNDPLILWYGVFSIGLLCVQWIELIAIRLTLEYQVEILSRKRASEIDLNGDVK